MPETVFVMVMCPTAAEAEQIAVQLLEERLIACANIAGRIRSLFHWKGALERATEFLLIMKSRASLFDALSARVKELHSYEVPEIIGAPIVMGSDSYLKWICESTTPPA